MELKDIFHVLNEKKLMVIPTDEFDRLGPQLETVQENDTGLCGAIRILEMDGIIIVAETPKPQETVLHLLASLEEARAFIQDRLNTYDRMWDGCGCKIDYHK